MSVTLDITPCKVGAFGANGSLSAAIGGTSPHPIPKLFLTSVWVSLSHRAACHGFFCLLGTRTLASEVCQTLPDSMECLTVSNERSCVSTALSSTRQGDLTYNCTGRWRVPSKQPSRRPHMQPRSPNLQSDSLNV